MFFLLPLLKQAISQDVMITMIGSAAAMLTTSSFLPQIVEAYRTKSMHDISRYLMSFFATGTVLWMLYGVFKSDFVIIGANATASAFNIILLYMKFAYGKKPAKLV
jgi:MtN3 and saliva related transmembrane protein